MSKWLALCADDYGASASINRGVLNLVLASRLSEVSCLVGGARWAKAATALRAAQPVQQGHVRAGLHFNLTDGRPLSATLARLWPRFPSLPMLMLRAHLGQLPLLALADELQAQWQAFTAAFGRMPAHLDGHQHVHQLPGIRGLVLAQLAAHPATRLRLTAPALGPAAGFKRWLIAASGGRALAREPQAQQHAANRVLLGAYNFGTPHYRSLMQCWLEQLPRRGGLLMCHPAEGIEAGDPIGAARQREWQYLASDAFADDLAVADVWLAHQPCTPHHNDQTANDQRLLAR